MENNFNLEKIMEIGKSILDLTIFTVNKTPITVSSIIVFILLFGGLFWISKWFSKFLENRFFSKLKIESGTKYTLKRIAFYFFVLISAVFSFQFIGIDLSGLTVIFGLLSVGIGFGLQNITSNFISGVILLFEQPIKVGDRVSIGDLEGDILEINMRSTTIRSLRNIAVIVPNSDFISNRVVNWSYRDPKIRLDIPVGVAYRSDLERVKKAMLNAAFENDKVIHDPMPKVMHMGFGDSALNMELHVWIAHPQDKYDVLSEINGAITRQFDAFNIEIPFPQQDVHIKKD